MKGYLWLCIRSAEVHNCHMKWTICFVSSYYSKLSWWHFPTISTKSINDGNENTCSSRLAYLGQVGKCISEINWQLWSNNNKQSLELVNGIKLKRLFNRQKIIYNRSLPSKHSTMEPLSQGDQSKPKGRHCYQNF